MESVELTGKTVEEIRAQAARQLGVPEDEVELEVLEEKRGLLGFIGGGLRAIARVKAEGGPSPEPAIGAAGVVAEPTVEGGGGTSEGDDALARLANRGEEVANEILRLMGLSVQARAVELGEEQVVIELTGDDIALVIGKHGDSLDALQLLVAVIANREARSHARIVLDAEGYRDRRHRALEATAFTYAAKAKQTQREVVIRDLKAYERRVIHLTLRDDPELETYSEGEGRHRNLVISPLSGSRDRREDEGEREEETEE